jgi:phosphopantetheinyl transferase
MSPELFQSKYTSLDELRSQFALHDDRSLSVVERQELGRWRDHARREAWVLGRLLSKRLIVAALGQRQLPLAQIEIRSRDDRDRGIRPRIRIAGELQPWSLSISHSDRGILVALSTVPGTHLGIDLAPIGVFRPSFLSLWFTEREQVWLTYSEPDEIAAAWAIKEAVYKAANIGDSFAPQTIEVERRPGGRWGCIYRGIDLSEICDIEAWTVDRQAAAACLLRRPAAAPQNGRPKTEGIRV